MDTTRSITYSVIPGKTGCISCWESSIENKSALDKSVMEEEMQRDVLILPSRPAVNLVSIQVGMIVSEVIKAITKIAPLTTTNKLIQFDFNTLQTSVVEEWVKNPDCKVCGNIKFRNE